MTNDNKTDRPPRDDGEPAEERIAKAIARAGVASRREAEAMIAAGRVTLNGEVLTSPAVNVKPGDRITVDGEPLPERERTRLWLYHKPRGLVTTARDPEGRPTVFESLPEDMPRVVAIGRLDINTEGLLLLTNDGGLAKVIAHPDTGWLRRYKVRAHGDIAQADLDKLRNGITIDGMEYGPIEATLDRVQGDNVWLTMGLREGKNREIKRILEHLGLQVNRLIRLSFGPFQLGDLEPGLVEEVRTKVLKEQLGPKLAAEAGVDFESPVRQPIAPFGPPKRVDRERHGLKQSPRGLTPDRTRPRERGPAAARGRPVGAPAREPGGLRHGTVWRAEEAGEHPRRGKPPRRGADPKAERAAAGQRPRERVGAIETQGRKVVVERLIGEPTPGARPDRKPRRSSDAHPPAKTRGARPDRRRTVASGDRRKEMDHESRGEAPLRRRPERPRDQHQRPPSAGPRRGPPGKGGRSSDKGGPWKGPPRGGGKGPPRGRRS